LWSYPKTADTELDRFWRPVINSSGPILLLIGGATSTDNAAATSNPVSIRELQQSESVAFADASTLSRITGVMMMKGKSFHIRRHKEAKLEDLREGPVVLIGAFNNDWTIRLADQIRFRFVRNPETRVTYIEDRQNPSSHWQVDQNTPYRS